MEPHSCHQKTELLYNRLLVRCVSSLGIPTPLELLQIEAFESKTRRELEDMQRKYLQLILQADNEKYLDIQHARHIVQIKELQIDLCHSLTAPIRKLPVETLCAIFSLCLPPHRKQITQCSAPFVLCLVSKAWRDISRQDPTLWTRIHFNIPSTFPIRHPEGINRGILRSLINRACNLPLTVFIIQSHSEIPRRFYELLHLLAECSPVCQHLSIQSDVGRTKELQSLKPEQLQRLESVSLRFRPNFRFGTKVDVFSSLPKLRTADLHVQNAEHMLAVYLPPQSLLELSLTIGFFLAPSHMINAMRKFVTRFTNLQCLHLVLNGNGFSYYSCLPGVVNPSRSPTPITFRSLKEINIRCGFRASLSTILRGFYFPTLQSFDLDAVSVPVRLIDKNLMFSNILHNNMPYFSRITNFRLIRINIEEDQLRELLQFTPLLTSLDIMRGRFKNHEFQIWDDNLLKFLMVSDNMGEKTPPPLLHLTDLHLYFYPENAKRYANMAISCYRWAVQHLNTRDQIASLFYNMTTVPRYPFRLHLKFQETDWEERGGVSDALGDLAGQILHTEWCHNFMRGTI